MATPAMIAAAASDDHRDKDKQSPVFEEAENSAFLSRRRRLFSLN
jgi:hypothetical protein